MLEIGSLVDGKYKILNVVGKGGMSVVYLAMNERANKQWAIKEVRKDGVQDFEVVKQNLIVETDILKNLNHPNLPSIIDVIDREDSFLIVMDYIEGKALSDVLKEYGAQPQEYVIEWAKQLCDVLGYLHSRVPPIIYRDMKPSNVMLKPDGNLTLIDFGTAREFKASKVEDTTCLGTRGYAAPEQYASYEKNAPVSIHNGRTVQWKDFARKEKVDDIYTMELTIKDKAGNESTDKKVFSVNRFGSNYIFGTDTQALLDKIYSNQEIPVEVREINVNSLKEKAISVKNEDNEITELQAGSDYTVTEGNDKYKWKEYRYVINGDVFAQESEYNVTLSSKDAAANEMNNVAKNKDIDFIIDKTNPTGIVSGLEESSYKEDSHKINVRAMDNYQLDEAVLYVDGSEYKTFASEDFQGDKGVEVTLDSKNKPQEIYLSLTDKAGNSVDLKKTQCLITSNAWIQYINNKPLFYSTVGGGAALIIAILGIATRGFGYASSMAAQSGFWWTILGKRREDEDED